MPFNPGDIVKIKPQYQDPGDEKIDWKVLEPEDGGRVLIEAMTGLNIRQTQRVTTDMIQRKSLGAKTMPRFKIVSKKKHGSFFTKTKSGDPIVDQDVALAEAEEAAASEKGGVDDWEPEEIEEKDSGDTGDYQYNAGIEAFRQGRPISDGSQFSGSDRDMFESGWKDAKKDPSLRSGWKSAKSAEEAYDKGFAAGKASR